MTDLTPQNCAALARAGFPQEIGLGDAYYYRLTKPNGEWLNKKRCVCRNPKLDGDERLRIPTFTELAEWARLNLPGEYNLRLELCSDGSGTIEIYCDYTVLGDHRTDFLAQIDIPTNGCLLAALYAACVKAGIVEEG